MVIKLSANLSDEVVNVIEDLGRKRNISMTEVIRQSISNEKFFQDVVDGGGKVLICRSEGSGGNLEEVIWR